MYLWKRLHCFDEYLHKEYLDADLDIDLDVDFDVNHDVDLKMILI